VPHRDQAHKRFPVNAPGLPNDFLDLTARGRRKEVVNVLNNHEMPPTKDTKQPKRAEVAAVVDWITEQSVRAELARRDNAVVLWRLNRAEYKNTVRDLLGVDFDSKASGKYSCAWEGGW
jgi:hypothetical protein